MRSRHSPTCVALGETPFLQFYPSLISDGVAALGWLVYASAGRELAAQSRSSCGAALAAWWRVDRTHKSWADLDRLAARTARVIAASPARSGTNRVPRPIPTLTRVPRLCCGWTHTTPSLPRSLEPNTCRKSYANTPPATLPLPCRYPNSCSYSCSCSHSCPRPRPYLCCTCPCPTPGASSSTQWLEYSTP